MNTNHQFYTFIVRIRERAGRPKKGNNGQNEYLNLGYSRLSEFIASCITIFRHGTVRKLKQKRDRYRYRNGKVSRTNKLYKKTRDTSGLQFMRCHRVLTRKLCIINAILFCSVRGLLPLSETVYIFPTLRNSCRALVRYLYYREVKLRCVLIEVDFDDCRVVG